jgi:hypothetical protein
VPNPDELDSAGRRNHTRAIPGALAGVCASAAAATASGARSARITRDRPSNAGITGRYLRMVTL